MLKGGLKRRQKGDKKETKRMLKGDRRKYY